MRLRASTVRKRSSLLFHWDYRDGFTRRGVPVTTDGREGTFTRASTKTAVDSNGRIYTVPSGMPAINHRYDATSTGITLWVPDGALFEVAGDNVVLQSENFGTTWTVQNTPTRTAQAKRCGTVYLDLIGDDSAVLLEGYTQPINFGSDGSATFSFLIAEGTSTTTEFAIHDSTAPASRCRGHVTWSSGVPSVAMVVGTHVLTERLADQTGAAVWRLHFTTSTITDANVNSVIFFPACNAAQDVSLTGNVYIGGVHAGSIGTHFRSIQSYIPTTTATVTRAADFLTFPALWLPRDLTMYVDHIELGTFQLSGSPFVKLGDDDTGESSTSTIYSRSGSLGDVRVQLETASTLTQSDLTTGAVAIGDRQEIRGAFLAAGIYGGRSINSAAENTSTPASALAHPSTYAESVICFTPVGSASTSFSAQAIRTVKVAIGERTMAQMRAAV